MFKDKPPGPCSNGSIQNMEIDEPKSSAIRVCWQLSLDGEEEQELQEEAEEPSFSNIQQQQQEEEQQQQHQQQQQPRQQQQILGKAFQILIQVPILDCLFYNFRVLNVC